MAAPPANLVAAATQEVQWLRQPIHPGNRYVPRWRRDYIATLMDSLLLALDECRKKREMLVKKIGDLEARPDLKEEIKALQEEATKASQEMDAKIRQAYEAFQKVKPRLPNIFTHSPIRNKTSTKLNFVA